MTADRDRWLNRADEWGRAARSDDEPRRSIAVAAQAECLRKARAQKTRTKVAR